MSIPFVDEEIKFIEYHFPCIKYIPVCDDVKIHIVKYLLDSITIANSFAKCGYTNCLKFINSFCSTNMINAKAIQYASENGHLEIVRLLIEANKPCSACSIRWASKNGHFEIVSLLIEAIQT